MRFWPALKASYADSAAFVIACPLLALIPVAFELLQHAAEAHIGMYDSIASAQAVAHHPLRMAFGMLKIAALTMPAYWVTRFLAFRDPVRAGRAEAPATRLFAGFFAFQIVFAAAQLFAPIDSASGEIALFIGALVIGILVCAWGVAAALGNAKVAPAASAAIMWRQIPWTFGFTLAATLPLMIPHYAFAVLAITGARSLLWPVLVVDSLLVGFLAALLSAVNYHAAMRAAAKAGVSLTPDGVQPVLAAG